MNRKRKLILNTISAIANQVVTLVCGLVLPRLIISHYGSTTNGLLSSITHFLAFFSMMEMGVGAVVRASLYKPLAENDSVAISKVLVSSRRFFRKIGLLLCVYTVGLMFYFPLAVNHENGYLSTAILVGAVAFSSLSTYLFGIVYQQLLNADQKSYIQLSIQVFTTILNTAFGIILIKLNASIEMVKLLAAFLFLLRPLLLKLYVDHNYKLDLKIRLVEEPIKQKWNGLAQHIATYILKHADTVVLTLFSTLDNVSIYYVYHLVTNGLQQLIEVLTTGMAALLGNMYVKKEVEQLNSTFNAFELSIHSFVTLLYSVAGVMIIPFVKVYTKGITDADYIVPLFSVLIVTANAAYCLRMPYYIMIQAAGHFKETQSSAIIEAIINVLVSVALVKKYGLIGVAIGTLVAMLYRTVYLALYLRKSILFRKFSHFVKHFVLDIVTVILVIISTRWVSMDEITWISWIKNSIIVGCISLLECFSINFIFYRKTMRDCLNLLLGRKRS